MRYERPNTQYATRYTLYAVVRSTSVEIALQISSILTNKPKVKYAKINVNSYETSRYVHMGHLVIQTNKPNSKPIQTQFQKLFDAQNQDFIKNPVQKIFELTFGFTTICCGQAYEKTPKFENKKVDNLSDGC